MFFDATTLEEKKSFTKIQPGFYELFISDIQMPSDKPYLQIEFIVNQSSNTARALFNLNHDNETVRSIAKNNLADLIFAVHSSNKSYKTEADFVKDMYHKRCFAHITYRKDKKDATKEYIDFVYYNAEKKNRSGAQYIEQINKPFASETPF
jgi:hypothetical protein